MSSAYVQTVTGASPTADIGRTLIHEHIVISNPGAEFDPGQAVDRTMVVDTAVAALKKLKTHGVTTFVDPCPIDLGRDASLLREVSDKAEMNIVCTTGFYHEERGLPWYWRTSSIEQITELYVREIEYGIGETGVKAGAIKCATSHVMTTAEEKFLRAACAAHRATGVPIITHTDLGEGGPEQQALFASEGVEPHRCLIGHCCGNADTHYHQRIVNGGSYIGFDRIGILAFQPDEVRADNLINLVRKGFEEFILMSQDRVTTLRGFRPANVEMAAWIKDMTARGEWPMPFTYLFTHFLPILQSKGLPAETIERILTDNPRRFFSGVAPQQKKPDLP